MSVPQTLAKAVNLKKKGQAKAFMTERKSEKRRGRALGTRLNQCSTRPRLVPVPSPYLHARGRGGRDVIFAHVHRLRMSSACY